MRHFRPVSRDKSGAATGLTRGEVIQEVNHKPVRNKSEYESALSASGNQPVLLLIVRGDNKRYVVVEPQ